MSENSKSQKTLADWLSEYGESHQNPTNKAIHWVCVPTIFVTIMGMVYAMSPILAYFCTLLAIAFYMRLSLSLGLSMGLFMVTVLWGLYTYPVGFGIWLLIFAVAWVGQFTGHHIEGKKPSFLEDVQFLMIGPAWVAHTLKDKIKHKLFSKKATQND